MFFPNFYFFNGTAYAGKSTMVRMLSEKHNGIACGENYHNAYLDQLDRTEYALQNFRKCLERINTQARYDQFKNAGFPVIVRDEDRTPTETMWLVEEKLGLTGSIPVA